MSDTKLLEHIGESRVIHELTKHGILTVKPFFDRDGADLVVLSDVSPSARIGVLQIKYRTISKSGGTSVGIPVAYVNDHFFLILVVATGGRELGLLGFFPEDIRGWRVKDRKYLLRIPAQNGFPAFCPQSVLTPRLLDELKRRIVAAREPLSFDAFVLGQNPVLWRVFENWRSQGIDPSVQELRKICEDRDLITHSSKSQIAFFYAFGFVLNDDLETDIPEFGDFVISQAKSDSPLVTSENIVDVSDMYLGTSPWHVVFPKYIIGKLTLRFHDHLSPLTGLYSLVRDSEGEGVEFFVPNVGDVELMARYIESGAREYGFAAMSSIEKQVREIGVK